MAKNSKSTALTTTQDAVIGAVLDQTEAFTGFQGEMVPEVWSFKEPGQCLDCTVVGPADPVYVKDEYDEEIPKGTWECAIQDNFRIRVTTNAQLDQMMPRMFGKYVRIQYTETIQRGKRQVKQYRAGVYSDQSAAVPLTPDELLRNETFLAERKLADEAKREAAKERERSRRGARSA